MWTRVIPRHAHSDRRFAPSEHRLRAWARNPESQGRLHDIALDSRSGAKVPSPNDKSESYALRASALPSAPSGSSLKAWIEKYLSGSVHTFSGCQPTPRASADSDSTLYL
jgi:hypothetical protein